MIPGLGCHRAVIINLVDGLGGIAVNPEPDALGLTVTFSAEAVGRSKLQQGSVLEINALSVAGQS